jgi:type VII secretion protein EccE
MPELTGVQRSTGRFGAVQLVALELAVVAGYVAIYASAPAIVGAAAVAGVTIVLMALGRSGGRWWYETAAAGLRLSRRRAAAEPVDEPAPAAPTPATPSTPATAPTPAADGTAATAWLARASAAKVTAPPRPAWAAPAPLSGGVPPNGGGPAPDRSPFAALAPDLTIHSFDEPDRQLGVGTDSLGWFGGVEVLGHDGLSRSRPDVLPLGWLARLVSNRSLPASTVQLVIRQAAGVADTVDGPDTVFDRSYRELLRTLSAPAARRIWIAVRLDPRDGAAAAGSGGDLTGVRRALAAGVTRVGEGLEAASLRHRVLDGPALRAALGAAFGNAPPATDQAIARETWSQWQHGDVAHVAFAVRGWPALPRPDLLERLAAVPLAQSVNTALVLEPTPRRSGEARIAARTLVRVSTAPASMPSCVEQLQTLAGGLGIRLVRLNGEHAAGVYATMPTGAAIGLTPW